MEWLKNILQIYFSLTKIFSIKKAPQIIKKAHKHAEKQGESGST